MKNSIFLLLIVGLIITSCNKKTSKKEITLDDKLSIEGVWSRSFAMGKDATAKVTYSIFKDSIVYEMAGPMKLNYTIIKDSSHNDDDRWIGNSGETQYVIFIKELSDKNITLLKKKVKSAEEAIKMKFPSDTARSQFSSWNTFLKKK